NDLNILAATDSLSETHFHEKKTSGAFGSGGVGFTLGSRQHSVEQQSVTTTAAASTVGSTHGDVILLAQGAYRQVGSDVLAPVGDTTIRAQKADIVEARETHVSQTEVRARQS